MSDISFTRLQPTNNVAPTPPWFIINSGVHTGRPHLAGWFYTALTVAPFGFVYPDGSPRLAVSIASCPRCFAMVYAEPDGTALGDCTWTHEQWHAATDYPIPEELLNGQRTNNEEEK